MFLPVSLGEGNNKKTMSVYFFVIPFENIYNEIPGRPFLTILDVLAPPVHMNINYHNDSCEPVVVKEDLRGAQNIYESILKNPY